MCQVYDFRRHCYFPFIHKFSLIFFQAVSGNFVENLNSNVNMLNNKTGLCDNEIVDVEEQNEIENNQLENELRRGSSSNMLVSQSFYSKERFKVLLGECKMCVVLCCALGTSIVRFRMCTCFFSSSSAYFLLVAFACVT